MLAMDLEAPYNVKLKGYGNVYSGYFKAPADARYRFYLACDDYCKLSLSNTTIDPTKKNLIHTSPGPSYYRFYFTEEGSRMTKWITLQKDNYYFIELLHYQSSGNDDASVAVEIEAPDAPNGH